MVCSYCKNEKKITREHLFPTSVLNLFPECDFNIDGERMFKGNKITIKDVCEDCNNGVLSILDNYGKGLVEKYFVKEYFGNKIISFDYNYNMLSRWLLKLVYNIARKEKLDNRWFNDNLEYILGEEEVNDKFSIFAGLAINTSPFPDELMGYRKLLVSFNPKILRKPIFDKHSLGRPQPKLFQKSDMNLEIVEFEFLYNSALVRLGSALFLIFLWENEIEDQTRLENEEEMLAYYPYKLLSNSKDNIYLNRVTHAFNYHHELINLIDSVPDMFIVDSFRQN
ncbi:hypothetical protein [Exiguobacterium sp. USCH10]|jgi:hypothetical protein|uniref:hypothetical protein n=1 Tax=Exiguobacterium sp. USCH10 TaxID=3024839 RepID=UPI0030B0E5B1